MLVSVTVVLVGITVRQVRLTRKALELTRDAVVATQKEADATAAAVQVAQEQVAASTEVTREAMRARVDQQAPRVLVRAIDRDPHVWYPSTVGGDPNPATTGPQIQFQVPRQDDQPLFVRVDLHLRNEGLAGGWVSCSAVEFLAFPRARPELPWSSPKRVAARRTLLPSQSSKACSYRLTCAPGSRTPCSSVWARIRSGW